MICLAETVVLLANFVLKNRHARVIPADVKMINAVSKTFPSVLDYVKHQPCSQVLLLHHFQRHLQPVIKRVIHRVVQQVIQQVIHQYPLIHRLSQVVRQVPPKCHQRLLTHR